MNALIIVLSIVVCLGISLFMRDLGPAAVLLCAAVALIVGIVINRIGGEHRVFLVRIFVVALLLRMLLGTAINVFQLEMFFGSDARVYDDLGYVLMLMWKGNSFYGDVTELSSGASTYRGMLYMVAVIYSIVGRNPLAVQFINGIIGAATAPVIFLCALHIYGNSKVARISGYFVAFFPSLMLWSSQVLKDGPIVFLLAVTMLATLKLGEKMNVKYLAALIFSMFGIFTLRYYIFYMVVVAVGGAFIIGMQRMQEQSMLRQLALIVGIGLAMTYMGVLRTAGTELETITDLQTVQHYRSYLATSAESGFGADVDVSTTSGALQAIPLGFVYLLFAPFPWQVSNLRQTITLPEMLVWWAIFPLVLTGLWYTLKYKFRQSLPILIFTGLLTIGYSIFQGNVGTAYRQRTQLLIFYFIFVAVGFVLAKERREDRRRAGN